MRITKLTPEQARTTGRLLQRALDWFRAFRERLRETALRLLEGMRAFARFTQRLQTRSIRPDRPAWASPYGPPPKRA